MDLTHANWLAEFRQRRQKVSDDAIKNLGSPDKDTPKWMDVDRLLEVIDALTRRQSPLRQTVRMCLEQFEFTYGKRKRGWDAVFLMEQCGAVLGEAAYRREGGDSLPVTIGALIDAWEGLPNDLKSDLSVPFVTAMRNLISIQEDW